jgi:integrase/recombinase XerD
MNLENKRLQQGFRAWLVTLGYSDSTIHKLPLMLSEFLDWLEKNECVDIKELTQQKTDAFMEYFKNRPNKRFAGGLSSSHINRQIDAILRFTTYLKLTNQATLNIDLKRVKAQAVSERDILSREEIKSLYDVTDETLIGIRDRAMLSVYYGCGLRSSEGLALEVSDVLFDRKLLYVRKTKNRYERYVPISLMCLQDLEQYIYFARPLLLNDTRPTEALFISERGKEIEGQSLLSRLHVLQKRTGIPNLEAKTVGLHSLRHSIATHLLSAGMELENVATFLGHRCLDSTQIYTHIINKL